jgi:hypothetical protein
MKRRFLILLSIAATLVTALGATALYAYWTSHGSGSGQSATATAAPITFSVTGQSSTSLYPGSTGDVTVKITNPFSQPITITSLTGTVTTSKESSGCPGASNFTVAANPTGLPTTAIGAGLSVTPTLSGAVSMKGDASNSCQAATITVAYSITGKL